MIVISISGVARSGKDTFVSIAMDILKKNGYAVQRISFADELKKEVSDMLETNRFKCSAYPTDTDVKSKLRPLLVWWGMQRRTESNGKYWIDRVDTVLEHQKHSINSVFFIPDCRFENEINFVKTKWNGISVHVRRYTISDLGERIYVGPPNEEERINDPIVRNKCDFKIENEFIPINEPDIIKNSTLRKNVISCLQKMEPFKNLEFTD